MQNRLLATTLGLLFLIAPVGRADVALPAVFSDHMVLQQQLPAAVWGTAAPDEKVTVTFRDQAKSTVAKADGSWRVNLDAMTATADQTPAELVIAGNNKVTFVDVVVGEVWLGSGQSNMAWQDFKKPADVAAADLPMVRLRADAQWPDRHHDWQRCTPENAAKYPSIMFYFATKLHKELRVPVGVITTGVGGSNSSSWIAPEALAANAAFMDSWKRYSEVTYPAAKAEYEAKLATWQKLADAATAGGKPAPKGKPGAPRPGTFPKPPECGEWYRKFIAPIEGYTIRGLVWDQGEAGSGLPGLSWADSMGILLSDWRHKWGQEFPMIYIQKPSGGGWEWSAESKNTKGEAVPPPALPKSPDDVARGGFSREGYLAALKLPKTQMCIAMDIGGGLHPETKNLYGRRTADVALGSVYGQAVAFRGPMYSSHAIEGPKIRVKFANIGKGLIARADRPLQGFAIAGADKNFVWADATIDGDSVVVSSPTVTQPLAVRYAWAENPSWANLFNADGLPAPTFRTDDWPEPERAK